VIKAEFRERLNSVREVLFGPESARGGDLGQIKFSDAALPVE